jgi:serine/arginine repetitive matrix protein 2
VFTFDFCLAFESPTEAVAFRARFNSLGSPVVLKATSKYMEGAAQVRPGSPSEPSFQDSALLKDAPHVSTPSSPLLEDAREPPLSVPPNTITGSIAVRAMRSMRSMARLANWANGKPAEKETTSSALLDKKEEPPEAKKTKKKTKRRSEPGKDQVISRLSVGSSDTGVIASHNITPTQASTARKHGVLGLGLPSALRFGTVRSSSAGLFNQGTASSANSLSRDGRGHFSSTVSAASSLRPNSSKPRISSSGSAPVKWVETVKGVCRRERVVERRDDAQCDSLRARSRSAIVDMFPDMKPRPLSTKSTSKSSAPTPIPTVKGTSAAALSVLGSGQIVTPRRARPASDQMIEKERLRNMQDDTDSELQMFRI